MSNSLDPDQVKILPVLIWVQAVSKGYQQRILADKEAHFFSYSFQTLTNKLYDRANKLYKAALLTRCYVQHFLSPYIDSEVNHKRHFIKIPFINKGIEFIDLHSIFKDNSVISTIPNYFNNSETPIICYKYNKPIRSTIFNFNKIVNDLDIDSNTPAS